MITKLTKTALLTTVFAASVSHVAQAGFTAKDLYLGFSQSTATSDYIIDLGQPTTLGVGGSSAVDLTGDFSLATFNSIFTGGPNGVTVAVVGGNNVPVFGVYATQVRTGGAGAPAVAGSSLTGSHSSTAMSGGASSLTGIAALAGGLPTAGNSVVDPNKTFTSTVDTTGVQNNFIGKTGVNPTGTIDATGVLYEDLYAASTSSPYTYLGYLTFDYGANSLGFTPAGAAPVPEPATCAILGVGLVGVLLRRRFAGKLPEPVISRI